MQSAESSRPHRRRTLGLRRCEVMR
jgi:hypothetical protein